MVDLLAEIQREGESKLADLIEVRTQETVTLDFKTKQDRSNGRFSKDDKTIFGKALSGFANSAGGLLVWGVDARKGEDGIDCAQDLLPIADIERFASEAQTLVGQLLIPRHEGIQVAAVPSKTEHGSGYLLVIVERSERRPHRCEAAGEKQYFKRAGDNTFAMEHYDIEDAFRRTGAPVLQFEVERTLGQQREIIDGQQAFQVIPIHHSVFVRNIGTAVARHVYMSLSMLSNLAAAPPSPTGVPVFKNRFEDEGQTYYDGSFEFLLHPGRRAKVIVLTVTYKKNWQQLTSIGNAAFGTIGHACCKLRIGAENTREISSKVQVNSQTLAIYLAEMGIKL